MYQKALEKSEAFFLKQLMVNRAAGGGQLTLLLQEMFC